MKLRIPLLLYTVATGLFGVAGWQAFTTMPLLEKDARDAATRKGIEEGTDKLALGKSSGPQPTDWKYSKTTVDWWAEFRGPNFLGKPPPQEFVVCEGPSPPPEEVRRLEHILELVSLVYASEDQGRGEISHVIVRYKPEANVQPPEYYMRETAAPSSTPAAKTRGDTLPPRVGGNKGGPQSKSNLNFPPPPLPSSMIGREIVQKLHIRDGGNPRRDPRLWPPFQDIKLVRVAPGAQSAFFVRTPPPPKQGEPAIDAKEEELFKSRYDIDPDMMRDVRQIQGGGAPVTGAASAPVATNASSPWIESDETTQVGNRIHIGKKDEQRFRDGADELLSNINIDTHSLPRSGTRGLRVLNVDPELARRFGVATGEVLLSVNGRAVTTRAQAMQFVKSEYEKGVRTFVTRWLSNGKEVERIYQAPDR